MSLESTPLIEDWGSENTGVHGGKLGSGVYMRRSVKGKAPQKSPYLSFSIMNSKREGNLHVDE